MNCIRVLRLCELQTANYFKLSSVRYVANHPMKFLETQERWRESDNVSKRWQLIYKAPMDVAMNYLTTYITFTTTSVTLAGLYYAGFVYSAEELNKPVLLGDDLVIANSPVECLVYLAAFIGFHAAVKILLSKYVIRMYQDGDEYLAVYRGSYYNSIKKHKFRVEDFKKLRPTFVVSWGDARFALGNKHAIILEDYFKTPEHFNYLLYKKKKDKPSDDE